MKFSDKDLDPILKEYMYKIKGFFWKKGLEQQDAEDLVQDVVLAIIDSLPRFEGRAGLATWIYAICNNVYRKKMYYLNRDKLLQAASQPPPPGDSADAIIDKICLKSVVDRLPVLDRKIYTLFYQQGFSIREITNRLQVPGGTVKYKLFAIRKLIKEYFQVDGFS